jgi:hypothetical protein
MAFCRDVTPSFWYKGPGSGLTRNRPFDHPRVGDEADQSARHAENADERQEKTRTSRRGPVQFQTYEITFIGQAGRTLRAEFDDCVMTVGRGTTTLRAELPDQEALTGLVERITGLGLEVVHVHLVAPSPEY